MRLFKALAASTILAAGLAVGAGPVAAMMSSPPPAAQTSSYSDGERLVKAKDYEKAIPLLQKALTENPGNADASNLLGYSYRKLGNQKSAFMYYQRALQIDPNHRGANEYLGELYVEMNDLPKAEAQLQKVTQLCGNTSCDEYRDLQSMIDKAKSAGMPAGQGPRTGS